MSTQKPIAIAAGGALLWRAWSHRNYVGATMLYGEAEARRRVVMENLALGSLGAALIYWGAVR